jgi:putative ABC transport system permease protein
MSGVDLRALLGRLAGPGVLVVGLGAAFTVTVVGTTRELTAVVRESPLGGGPTATIVLGLLGTSFGVVTLVVAGSVLANSTATRVAAEVHDIALRRLLGASTRQERRRQVERALVDAVAGLALGTLVGWLLAWTLVGHASSPLPALPVLLGVGGVALLAAWRGSQAVASVSPAGALAVADAQSGGVGRHVRWPLGGSATVLLAVGLLATAALLGMVSPYAVLPGLAGGVLLAAALPSVAPAVVPRWLHLLGLMLPRSLAGSLAARRLEDNPQSTARASLGVVLGVAVVTMFVVAAATFDHALRVAYSDPQAAEITGRFLDLIMATVVPMVALIASISAVGLVETVVAESRLRSRETGLLRILGQSRNDVRAEILHGAARLAVGSTLLGVLLGAAVGWAGAQSILGSVAEIHVVAPVLPPLYLLAVSVVSVALTLASAAVPLRQRLGESPVGAFSRV